MAQHLGNPVLIGHSSGGLIMVQKLAGLLDPPAVIALVPATKVRCPMLVIGTAEDRITPLKASRR